MSRGFLLVGVALGALTLSTAARAQLAPRSSLDSTPAPAMRGADALGLRAGVRVRLTLSDSLVQLRPGQSVGRLGRIEGALVALDSVGLELRLRDGRALTVPAGNVRTLERRAGVGPCRRTLGARAACVAGGMVAGAALGAWFGDMVGRQIDRTLDDTDPADTRRRWRVRGAAGGTALALGLSAVFGRDRWVAVPGWAAAPND